MGIHLPFNLQKTTQALNFFAIASGGSINKMEAIKLLFFSDRYHLRKYGRSITNDEYYAMEYGPVPSNGKDIEEHSDFLAQSEKDYVKQFIRRCSQYDYESINPVDKDVLSESDVEALEFAWSKFQVFDQFQLADLTHDYPEWRKHENQITDRSSRIPMDYEDFFLDPINDDYFQIDEQIKQSSLASLKELSEIEKLWK